MTLETITQKIRNKRMASGVMFGVVAGFFLRDEFYYPTYLKIQELVDSYNIN